MIQAFPLYFEMLNLEPHFLFIPFVCVVWWGFFGFVLGLGLFSVDFFFFFIWLIPPPGCCVSVPKDRFLLQPSSTPERGSRAGGWRGPLRALGRCANAGVAHPSTHPPPPRGRRRAVRGRHRHRGGRGAGRAPGIGRPGPAPAPRRRRR